MESDTSGPNGSLSSSGSHATRRHWRLVMNEPYIIRSSVASRPPSDEDGNPAGHGEAHLVPQTARENPGVVEDDELPPLQSDSDESDDSNGEEESGGGEDVEDVGNESDVSMPSLQTLSNSSNSDLEDVHSDDDSEWDDSEVDDEHELFSALDTATRRYGGRSSGVGDEQVHPHPPPGPNFDFFLHDYYANLSRPLDLIDLLMDPRRQAVDNDPLRAQTLMGGLEVVPEELIIRYEQVRKGVTDCSDGCVICREELATFPSTSSEELSAQETAVTAALFSTLPFHPSNPILAFPCPGKHLFHRQCIAPWLARKTTCPTCRFDIDPDSLTLRRSTSPQEAGGPRPVRTWEPPRGRSFLDWLEREERIRDGILDPMDALMDPIPPAVDQLQTLASFEDISLPTIAPDHEDDEDDEDSWVDTDSETDGSRTPAHGPDSADDLSRLLRDASQRAAIRAGVVERLPRTARTQSASFPALSLRNAVREDVYFHALQMGRSLTLASRRVTPSTPLRNRPDEDGASDNEH